jgi:tRNA-dihydrouridine synthase
MRKHLAWYLKGLPDSAAAKNSIMELQSRAEVESELGNYVIRVDEILAREAGGASESGEILVH